MIPIPMRVAKFTQTRKNPLIMPLRCCCQVCLPTNQLLHRRSLHLVVIESFRDVSLQGALASRAEVLFGLI